MFSNACKFTPTGGKLLISTRLIMPHLSSKHAKFGLEDDDDDDDDDDLDNPEDMRNGAVTPTPDGTYI